MNDLGHRSLNRYWFRIDRLTQFALDLQLRDSLLRICHEFFCFGCSFCRIGESAAVLDSGRICLLFLAFVFFSGGQRWLGLWYALRRDRRRCGQARVVVNTKRHRGGDHDLADRQVYLGSRRRSRRSIGRAVHSVSTTAADVIVDQINKPALCAFCS